jgi:hypothetical protein
MVQLKMNGTNGSSAPNNAFVQNVLTAYNYDVKNGGGDNLKEAATNPNLKISITEVKTLGSDMYYNDNGNDVIYWNPFEATETEEGLTFSAATALEHEADHGVQAAKDYAALREREKTYDAHYDNKEEQRVITGSEKKTAKANGEFKEGQVRKSHRSKKDYRAVSPTSTKAATNKSITNSNNQTSQNVSGSQQCTYEQILQDM